MKDMDAADGHPPVTRPLTSSSGLPHPAATDPPAAAPRPPPRAAPDRPAYRLLAHERGGTGAGPPAEEPDSSLSSSSSSASVVTGHTMQAHHPIRE